MVTTTILLALSLAANAVTATPVRIPQIQALEEASDINTTTAVAVPEDNQLANNNHIVAARGEPINGTLICGNFPNGKGLRARALIDALREGDLRDHQYHLDPHGCNRVNCWHKTGIHVCNDNNHPISVTGQEVYDAATVDLTEKCCDDVKNKGRLAVLSGQQFTQYGWNVIVGYANCHLPVTQKPDTLGPASWGANPGSCTARSHVWLSSAPSQKTHGGTKDPTMENPLLMNITSSEVETHTLNG